MTSAELTTLLDTSNSESPEDSVSMLLYYQALKASVSKSYQEKAINYLLNGLHLDGTFEHNISLGPTVNSSQDNSLVQVTSQILDTISKDFSSLASSNVILRTVSIFSQIATAWNSNLSSGLAIQFSPQDTSSLFNYADRVLQNINIIDILKQEDVKGQIAGGIENILRGSLISEPNGNSPYVYIGTNLTASITKLNVNGFINLTSSSFMSPIGKWVNILSLNRPELYHKNTKICGCR